VAAAPDQDDRIATDGLDPALSEEKNRGGRGRRDPTEERDEEMRVPPRRIRRNDGWRVPLAWPGQRRRRPRLLARHSQ
jgi:hypothetical protein